MPSPLVLSSVSCSTLMPIYLLIRPLSLSLHIARSSPHRVPSLSDSLRRTATMTRETGHKRKASQESFDQHASDRHAAAQRANITGSRGGEPIAPRPTHSPTHTLSVTPEQSLYEVVVDYSPTTTSHIFRKGEQVRVFGKDESGSWLCAFKDNATDAQWIPRVYLEAEALNGTARFEENETARSVEQDQEKRDTSAARLTEVVPRSGSSHAHKRRKLNESSDWQDTTIQDPPSLWVDLPNGGWLVFPPRDEMHGKVITVECFVTELRVTLTYESGHQLVETCRLVDGHILEVGVHPRRWPEIGNTTANELLLHPLPEEEDQITEDAGQDNSDTREDDMADLCEGFLAHGVDHDSPGDEYDFPDDEYDPPNDIPGFCWSLL